MQRFSLASARAAAAAGRTAAWVGDFLASLATGPGADPHFCFEPHGFEEVGEQAVLVPGSQVYRWRESDEVASSSEQSLRLEFGAGLVVRATVEPS